MADVVLRAEGLSKKYLIGHEMTRERYTALRDVIGRTARDLARSARDMLRGRQLVVGDEVEEYWALKDINFEIKRGEVVGIIGRNGAGKSTLLKILSRITEPSEGRVTIKGRVASLLEVGTGFHPELTGRENIFLNGAILGMTRAEIRRKFDEIVDFADIEKFLDTPVKRYSSGMYVRLAFAVAAHLEPEILIVDEVLAVGDAEFQKKCLGKMRDVAGHGRTVLFVSHNMGAVRALCSRGMLLKEGKVAFDADVESAASRYVTADATRDPKFNVSGRRFDPLEVRVSHGRITQRGRVTSTLASGEPFAIEVDVQAIRRRPFSVELLVRDNQLEPVGFCAGGLQKDFVVEPSSEFVGVVVDIANVDLAGGTYYVDVMLVESGVKYFDFVDRALSFDVSPRIVGASNWSFSQSRRQGSVLLDARFSSKASPDNALPDPR
jgi:lipopolysaccharide transport system ATP-binding protein